MQALNRKEINKKAIHFWIIFLMFVIYTHILIYFFIWSSQKQNTVFASDLTDYKKILNKQTILSNKIDSLYLQTSYLGTEAVSNQFFLEQLVANQKNAINKFIDKDSAQHFAAYTCLTEHLNDILIIKDSIIKVSDQESFVKNDLIKCIEENKKSKADIVAKTRALTAPKPQ